MNDLQFLAPFFAQKRVVILISASVSLYKMLDVISTLTKFGAHVKVVMSKESTTFINPMLFEALSKNVVLHQDTQNWTYTDAPNHTSYARWAEVVLIAPATANTIAKLACGIADDIILCTALASNAPKLIAPAMNTNMLNAPQTRENLAKLQALGFNIIEPRDSLLACGEYGKGALAKHDDIIFALAQLFVEMGMFHNTGFWHGKEVIITGGGSKENIDSVRVLSNLSSGKQAYFLALALYVLGAKVFLISSSVPTILPQDLHFTEVSNSLQYYQAIIESKKMCKDKPILFMAAAIADFIPEAVSQTKIKKDSLKKLQLTLEKNMDILSKLPTSEFVKVGFKAEDDYQSALQNAKEMLHKKECKVVCLNVLDSLKNTFGADTNQMTLISADATQETPLLDKFSLSFEILAFTQQVLLNDDHTH